MLLKQRRLKWLLHNISSKPCLLPFEEMSMGFGQRRDIFLLETKHLNGTMRINLQNCGTYINQMPNPLNIFEYIRSSTGQNLIFGNISKKKRYRFVTSIFLKMDPVLEALGVNPAAAPLSHL